MPLISDTIPNLINGVSQQPPTLRLPTQAQEMVNCYPTVVDGLRKRPPTQHLAEVLASLSTDAFIHLINRSASERYIAIFYNNDLKVFDINGTEKTVSFPDGKAYITTSLPSTDFRAVTIADYTFLVNTDIITDMGTALSANSTNKALIYVRAGAYGRTYSIATTSGTGSYTTPNGGTASDAPNIATTYIAGQLVTALGAAGVNGGNGYTVTQYGSVILISRTSAFNVSVDDGQGGVNMTLAKGLVQRFTDLPPIGPADFIVQVGGTAGSTTDAYYVKSESVGGSSNIVWKETLAPGIEYTFDAATMPHVLVRNPDDTFTFKRATWKDRIAGDEDSAPNPTFIGRAINDIFFHKNRLGFLADENVIMSSSGDFFNFWPKTVQQVLDDAPIDVAASHTKVSILKYAVPFNESLFLFSDQTQFKLESGNLLTPKTAAIITATEFESKNNARPVGAGSNIYFALERGEFSAVREYYISIDNESEDALEITAATPKYIPANVFKLAASSNEDVLVCLSKNRRDAMWVYKYFWSGQDKLQSAWFRWEFGTGTEVLNADFIQNELFVVIKRADGVHIEKVDVAPGLTDPNGEFLTHLDRRVDETKCTESYNATLDRTTITLPYDATANTRVVARDAVASQPFPPGYSATIVSFTGNQIVVEGDWSAQTYFVGENYTSTFTFSPIYVRKQGNNASQVSVLIGNFMMRFITLSFDKTAFFRVEVLPKGRVSTYKYVFTGRVIGSNENVLDTIAIEQGTFRFPVMAKADEVDIKIINDTPFPCQLLSADWEGAYNSKSRVQ